MNTWGTSWGRAWGDSWGANPVAARMGSGGVYIRDDDPVILALRDEELLVILAAIMPRVIEMQEHRL